MAAAAASFSCSRFLLLLDMDLPANMITPSPNRRTWPATINQMIVFLFNDTKISTVPNIKVRAWPAPWSLKFVSWSKLIESSNGSFSLAGIFLESGNFIPEIWSTTLYFNVNVNKLSFNLIWQLAVDFPLLGLVFVDFVHPAFWYWYKRTSCKHTKECFHQIKARLLGKWSQNVQVHSCCKLWHIIHLSDIQNSQI